MNKEKIREYQKFYEDYLLNDVVPYWVNSDLIDKEYGGFITSLDREGKSYNDDKSVWFQGRCLWTFSKLCNVFGPKKEWVEAAKSGADFIKKYCIDEDGRMFFTVTRKGEPLRKRRYFYSESFLVVGFAEYSLVTGNKEDLLFAEKYFDLMYQLYRNPESDPFKITPKENADVRSWHSNAYPMVLVSSAQTLRRLDKEKKEYYDEIIKAIIDDMINLHYKEEYKCVLENVTPTGEIIDNPTGRTINPGHSIENSWFLMNYANTKDDKELLEKALNIFNLSVDRGYDKEFGGIFYFVDLFNRPCEQLEHDMKLWWVHNEALIASLTAYKLTNDDKYFKEFEMFHEYCFNHFADKEFGEWYGYLHRDGTVSHTQKGSLWKGPYHLPRCLILVNSLLKSLLDDDENKLNLL